ncbi:MAG: DHH family phosphoesterase [Oscillospiraceae bacterium]|nr:DHH family phosphoesterase [Oscillospiraceae bacterium]
MNKKLPRLFQSSVRLYFMFLIAFAVATFVINDTSRVWAGVIQIVVLVLLALYSRISTKIRTAKLLDYLESMSDGMDMTVRDTPLPVVVFNSETSEILWSNERFQSITDDREHLFERRITDVVPGFSQIWLLDGKSECPDEVSVGDKTYKVSGQLVRTEREYIATTYWVDVTEYAAINREYADSRLVSAILMLDNYEELLKGMTEKEKSILLSDIDEKISLWSANSGGSLVKFDRDRYMFLFEERDFEGFVEDKFSILDSVRECEGSGGVHATLSIGIGKDGTTPQENHAFSKLGLEMALSRGGDQAVVRNKFGFEFFGGHSARLEKRTKVKSRVMASAFGGLLSDASTVFVMSHKQADFDSIGAAAGICCIARAKGKKARIVVDMENNFAKNLISRLMESPEYKDVFISDQDAMVEADAKSLLVVVDTSRPEQVESEPLLLSCTRVAVIDHHRRAATYIENAILNFHEPYASSTCELVTEMLQYLVDTTDILRAESEALLAGIVLDTKSFTINTGSRTFEAASYLRRSGSDTADVKRLLQSDFETATARYAIMREAEIIRPGVALAWSDEPQNRLTIAQASDELLNIEGVTASFVLARSGDDVFVSGRSIGDLNVQLVLEKLGGGGNNANAGVQLHSADLRQVVTDLTYAIDEYLEIDEKRKTNTKS